MRRELIACDVCQATRDSLEPSGVVLQAWEPGGTSVVGDLCDACWNRLLDALDVTIDLVTSGNQRRLKRREKLKVGNLTIPLEAPPAAERKE